MTTTTCEYFKKPWPTPFPGTIFFLFFIVSNRPGREGLRVKCLLTSGIAATSAWYRAGACCSNVPALPSVCTCVRRHAGARALIRGCRSVWCWALGGDRPDRHQVAVVAMMSKNRCKI